jgi:two-component system response regulator RegA
VSAELARSLLLVDDDEVFRCRLARAFRDRGWDVREAGDLDSALRTAEEDTPEYVVVDLRLPDGSGLEVVRRLKTLDATTTVVVLTGYACSIATALDALRLGAAHSSHKPAAVDDLVTGFALRAAMARTTCRWRRRSDRRHALAGARRVGAHQRVLADSGATFGSRAASRPAPACSSEAGQVSGGPMSPAAGACQGRCAVSPGHLPSHMVRPPATARSIASDPLVARGRADPWSRSWRPAGCRVAGARTLKLRFPRTVIPAGGNVEGVCLPASSDRGVRSVIAPDRPARILRDRCGHQSLPDLRLPRPAARRVLGAQEKQVIESRGVSTWARSIATSGS